MQQDQELFDALRTDLAELTALYAPPGAEQPVIARLHDLFAPLIDSVRVDHMGNLTAIREGPAGSPHIVVSAHADEIGAMVASAESERFLRLLPLGGVQLLAQGLRTRWHLHYHTDDMLEAAILETQTKIHLLFRFIICPLLRDWVGTA